MFLQRRLWRCAHTHTRTHARTHPTHPTQRTHGPCARTLTHTITFCFFDSLLSEHETHTQTPTRTRNTRTQTHAHAHTRTHTHSHGPRTLIFRFFPTLWTMAAADQRPGPDPCHRIWMIARAHTPAHTRTRTHAPTFSRTRTLSRPARTQPHTHTRTPNIF